LRKLLALTALASALAATPASAQLQPATGAELERAIASCLKAAHANGVDLQSLAADGWQPATMERDGKTIAAGGLFGHRDSNAVLLVPPEAGAPKLCAVMARVGSADQFATTASGISKALGTEPASKEATEYKWLRRPQAVDLAATGSAAAPSLRIAIIPLGPEQK
jgi:hypothetical protein